MTAVLTASRLRRPPQYGLRALLVLVTAVSVALGLWASREHAYRARLANIAPLVSYHQVCVEKAGRDAESLRVIIHVDELARDDVVVSALCNTSVEKEVAAVLALPTLKELRLGGKGPDAVPCTLEMLKEAYKKERGQTLPAERAVEMGPYVFWGEESPLGTIDPLLREIASKLPSLEKLDLVATSLSGAGLRRLTALRSLRSLDLSRTRISDDNLACIPAMPALEELILDDTGPHRHLPLDPAELAQVRATSYGRELTSGHEITDDGLRHLAGASRLRVLSLRKAKVTGAGLAYISAMSRLWALSLEATAVDDVSLRRLARLPSLNRLSLRETRITDAGLMHLAALPSLKRLDLYGVKSITAAGVARLQALRPELEISRDGSMIADPRSP